MVVDLINHRKPDGATEPTVLGPFHRQGSPELPLGSDIGAKDKTGTPTFVSGHVVDVEGRPIAGAVLDIWQTASNGFYDSQDPELGGGLNMRGIFRSDKDGRYFFWTTRPLHYSIPTDGPVGRMLRATNRHPFRPAHIHFIVTASGYQTLTTHVFDSEDKHLKDDTVFAVKESLIREFVRHDTRDQEAERLGKEPPFCTVEFDIVMNPVRQK
jgi:catechol 1,2-dioxygenase